MAPLQVRNFEKGFVYLFQFAGTENAPSLSPYCVKVDAFCRMHNLNYKVINTRSARGSNGLLPFIELDGVQTCESQAILKRLSEYFQIKNYVDTHTEGLAHAIERQIENYTIPLLHYDAARTLSAFIRVMLKGRIPACLMPCVASVAGFFMSRKTRGSVKKTIGNFTEAEFDGMLRNDLLQLQNVIGDKQFLMGEAPTQVDCLALAHIGSAYYRLPQERSKIHSLIDSKELSVLKEYFERLVARLYNGEFKDKQKE